jgi:hypothetical protein
VGYASAADMAANLERRVALEWHLRYNHYPPVPLAMVEVAEAAIEAGNDEDYDRMVSLPEGVTTRDGSASIRAGDVVEMFHLDAFIELA